MPGMHNNGCGMDDWDKPEPQPRRITDGLSAPANTIKPISPADIAKKKIEVIPPLVIEVFNDLIAKKFTAGSAKILQDDVIAAIITRKSITRAEIFEQGWLNIEEIYRAQGWLVEYDKPAYNENYKAYFTFEVEK
jgi:hypothetical protein